MSRRLRIFFLAMLDDILVVIMILLIFPLIGISLPIWLIISIITILLTASVFVYIALKAMERPIEVGKEAIIGKKGEAISDLNPEGLVFVNNEVWSAIAMKGKINSGEKVVVKEVMGVKLVVDREN